MIGAPRVLLVGHDASATGAPLVALEWAKWAARSGAASVEVDLDRGGPLAESFRAVAPTRIRSTAHREAVAVADAIRMPTGAGVVRRVMSARRRASADVTVVAASVASWRSAAALAGGGRLVLWVHELDGVADRLVAPEARRALLAATDHLVVAGDRVATMVTERWQVPADRVSVVDEFVDALPDEPHTSTEAEHHDVIAVGSLVPRKGAEHVVALVALLARDRPSLRAAWVGGDLSTPYADLIRTDVLARGVGAHLDLPGQVSDVDAWWPTGGVVVHLAREDPNPLVVLEAGLRGIPVITWDTGGAADLLRQAGLGRLVAAPGDLSAVAEQVGMLLDDPDARSQAGSALRAAAVERTTDQLAPLVLEAIVGVGP